MTGFASTWANAPVEGENNPAPDPGTYEVSVQDARAFMSKAGNEVLIVEFRVVTGDKTGYTWPEVRGFGTEGQTKAAKSMCARLGVNVAEITSLDELDSAVKEQMGAYFTVDVVQNGEYLNTFVNGRVNGQALESDVPDDAPVHTPVAGGDEDIPF